MNDCRRTRKNLAAYLSGELDGPHAARVAGHLDGCESCRRELAGWKDVFEKADAVRAGIGETMKSVDWEGLSARIAGRAPDQAEKPVRESRPAGILGRLFRPNLGLVYAGIGLGILIGSAATYLVLQKPSLARLEGRSYSASAEYLDRVELAMARRDALDYLDKSRYIILDFIQSSPGEPGSAQAVLNSGMARDLLARKKYLNPQLDKRQMAKAKAICDQIEMLFFELVQISGDLPEAELRRIQRFIEDRQLLLKINLLKEELEQSEV
ncbi:MAG TPA: zf-HC2 domain-containing protein [Candidatus Aminicenantes bacterium]|nr:zf-HC2 domain-containing protein [Candidatus Aminicenantes bacterium]